MDKWLGQIVTIRKCPDADTRHNFYRIEEDQEDRPGGGGWSWRIDGFAEIIDDPWDFEPDGDIADLLGLCGFCDPDHLFIEEVSDADADRVRSDSLDADDFIISSRYEFAFRAIENHIREVLASFDAPFTVKPEKTRYGSSAGANWNLGVMINADNQITVGYKRKREFKAMLTSYILDKQRGVRWEKNDIQVLDGYRNYYRMVEKDTIDDIIRHLDEKFKSNVVKMIKEDLKAA